MKRMAAWCWRWSWILTLPAALFFSQWLLHFSTRYYTFALRYNSAPIKMSALSIGQMEFFHLKNKLEAYFTQSTYRRDNKERLRRIHLYISEPNVAKLEDHLPYSGSEYVKAGLLQGDSVQQVKVKYRGDTALHWAFYKKSTRIKTRKSRLFEGMRSFNLIAPKFDGQLHNHLALRLASLMKLIAPRTEMIDLMLNGKPAGVFNLVEQIDEGTLRRIGRMPGDIYAGEWVGKDRYHGISGQVFLHPRLWEKISINNHYPEESRKPLERLLMLINAPPSEQKQEELSRILDIEAWGRFSAFEVLTQSLHYDSLHNWRLYYDPWRTRFEPIVWDPVGWHPSWLPRPGKKSQQDIILTRLHRALFQNGEFLRARHRAIEDFFNLGIDQDFTAEVDATIAAVIPAIERDPNLVRHSDHFSNAIRQLQVDIDHTFSDIQDAFLGSAGPIFFTTDNSTPNVSIIKLSIDGRPTVRHLHLSYADAIATPREAYLTYFSKGHRVRRNISAGVTVKGSKIAIEAPLIARHVPITIDNPRLRESVKGRENRIRIEPAYYELELAGVPDEHELLEVSANRGNGIEPAVAKPELEMNKFEDLFSVVSSRPIRMPLIWNNTLEIRGVVKITDELIIRPGTIVRMHTGASLIIHNRVVAQGTAQRPIKFLPASEGQEPWGTVALKGRGTDNSRFVNCEFSGGSGLKDDLAEYSGMFSVHDVVGVEINNCLFRESNVVDDMVHVVYSDIRFVDSVFHNALLDALDLDISSAVLERCRFMNSGNDALDLMTSEVVLRDTLLEGNRDKGVSIGEDSYLHAINNQFVANAIGIQAKDSSVAVLYNTDFINNNHAVDAYKKNWRYGDGGEVFLYKGRVLGNTKLITADKHSTIWVHDTYLDQEVPGHKSIRLDDTVDSSSQQTAAMEQFWLFPEDQRSSRQSGDSWDSRNPMIRGTSNFD